MSASVLSANADDDPSDLDENYSISDAPDNGPFYDEDIGDFDAISTGEVDLEVPGDENLRETTQNIAPEASTSPPISPHSSSDEGEILPPSPPPINIAHLTTSEEIPKPPPGKSIAH
jgi:hypothetical protein